MPKINAPPPEPALADLDLFAKAYFNINLTQYQKQLIMALTNNAVAHRSKHPVQQDAAKMLRLYIEEGLKPGGRVRLPQVGIPVKREIKGVTQHGRILYAIKHGGAFNFELSRIALKYTSVISELRKDGHHIVAERMIGRNGKKSNTFRYYLIGE